MDKLEKIERLKERANVTYEEAKAALEQSDGDLLDAIVLLERQGKVKQPQQTVYSTEYEEQKEYIRVQDIVEEQKKSAPDPGHTIEKLFRTIADFVLHSSFHISRGGEDIFSMPSLVMVALVLFFWKGLIPVALIAMLFGIRYSFEGQDGQNTDKANEILSKAGAVADDVQNSLHKEG